MKQALAQAYIKQMDRIMRLYTQELEASQSEETIVEVHKKYGDKIYRKNRAYEDKIKAMKLQRSDIDKNILESHNS